MIRWTLPLRPSRNIRLLPAELATMTSVPSGVAIR